ncbi:hypothetical protein CERZMDRAFT_99016 [Cercospora zeae-maydis SCOH1-5]|uniref:Uncharacterized protein n=1 Tax=Cercospora zeae-maydis SCOH1-5 TaxID=717836 RepID=A0A6A6FBR6_9PEZI|nr:hypothetical protein CERZMDRAFT_99016 [Cercospora zeae-maydis SCOH1-5]
MHITPEEYQQLPASVQKKYFSSVERLRILQQSASDQRTRQSTPAPSPSSFDTTRPRTSHSIRAPSIRASRKSSIAPVVVDDVNEDQALRFLALPDKVKRSHFSEEELLLLTESSQRTLGLRGQGSLPRWPQHVRSMSIASTSSQKSTGLEEEADWCDAETTSVGSADPGASEPDLSETWPHLNTIACSAYVTTSSTVDVSWTPSPRKSFTKKRALSLTPLPLPPPTLLPQIPPLPRPNTPRSARSPQADTPSHPKTQFYKDSQARSKLRAFLASPEKFDEALEFGFPVELPEKQLQHNAHEPTPAMEQFFYDETPDENDEEALSNNSSVASPMTVDSFSSSEALHAFPDSGVALKSKSSFRSFTPDFDGREMTLRLTLTRRELLAPEDQLYAVQRTQVSGVDVETVDPLALGTLQFCDDPSGKQGAFAVDNRGSRRGLKKIWSSMRRR